MYDVTFWFAVAVNVHALHVPTLGSVGSALLLVATMILYPVFPLTFVQEKVGVVDWFVAPLDGDSSVGAGRLLELFWVVKLNTLDQLPYAELVVGVRACTSQ